MQLTLHFDYALRTLIFLAAHRGQRVTTPQISAAYGISRNHLVRVVQNLEKNGFIKISHGRTGGLELAREPKAIRFGEVMRAIEPSMKLVECFEMETNTCPIAPVCKLKGILRNARDAFVAVLDEHSLADIIGPDSSKQLSKYLLT